MIETINQSLETFIRERFDSRIQHCRIAVAAPRDGRYPLGGTILDEELAGIVAEFLTSRFPDAVFDWSAAAVLRRPDPTWLTVTTNLAGLHRHPSRTSEQVSQLLYGARFEQLLVEGDWIYGRQPDGYLGWVYGRYLAAAALPPATHRVRRPVSLLREAPEEAAPLAGRLFAGTEVAAAGDAAASGWIRLELAGGPDGWAAAEDLVRLGDLPRSSAARRQQMAADAWRLIGVPYGWGGCTALGIDCSGLTQLVHRLAGVTLPRDADMQFAAGRPVEPPFQTGDLLFFGSARGHRSISHVGLSLGGWRMIHASGPRNGVYVDDVEEAVWLREIYAGARSFLE